MYNMNKVKHSNVKKVYFENKFLTNETIFIKPMSFERILLKLLQGQ